MLCFHLSSINYSTGTQITLSSTSIGAVTCKPRSQNKSVIQNVDEIDAARKRHAMPPTVIHSCYDGGEAHTFF